MSDGPWIKFYPADWLTGTRGMSAAEIGVYITLIATMYEKGGPVAVDAPRLARACGLPLASFNKIVEGLIDADKLTRTDAGLFNQRVEIELQTRQSASVTASNSAKARWQKDQEKQQPDNADALREASSRARARNQKTDIRVDHPSGDSAPAAPRDRGTRLSDEWVLPKPYGDWALAQGLPRERILIEADKMKNWSINAGRLGVKKDWFAAWKNWVQKAIDELPRARGGAPPGGMSALDQRKQQLAERIKNEHGIGRERDEHPANAGFLPLLIEAKR